MQYWQMSAFHSLWVYIILSHVGIIPGGMLSNIGLAIAMLQQSGNAIFEV